MSEPSKERGCDGKMKLPSKFSGYTKTAERLAKKHGKKYGVYKCPHCDGTHLTTKLFKRYDYSEPLLYVTY